MAGSNLVDVMPIFEKLPRPLQWWKARGTREFNSTLKAYSKPWFVSSSYQFDSRARLVEDIKNGKSEDCFAAHLYQKREEYGLTENEAMFAGPPHQPQPGVYTSLPVRSYHFPPLSDSYLFARSLAALRYLGSPSDDSVKCNRRWVRYHSRDSERLHHSHGRRPLIPDSRAQRSRRGPWRGGQITYF